MGVSSADSSAEQGGKHPELSVVIPIYNEVDSVAPLLDEVYASLNDQVDFEVVAVDDGSDDGSAAQLTDVEQRWPGMRLVRHRTNYGKSAAICTGARAAKGRWVATLDGDGQNDPADIPAHVSGRYLHYTPRSRPIVGGG